jgi:hypothetical protein
MSNFDYYSFRIRAVTDKINEEIAFYENCDYFNVYPIKDYLVYLKSRIGTDKAEMTTMTHYDNSGNKREIKKLNMDEYTKDLDVFVFKKPWNKLREFHKIMKIKEYVDNLAYNIKTKQKNILKNKEYLKEEICMGIKNKKFGKNKSEIIYDQEKMTIMSISSLDYNKKTGLYVIDWDS